jgi:4-diphosphocytidyl-2-C-methyl-D-erythritol kinase
MSVYRALAPAKINLGLFLGPVRASDARHELVTVMQSISLADELRLEPAPPGVAEDEVICPGVAGPPQGNLAAAALRAFRAATGWDADPLRLSIVKRIPVAAGLAGGSADAAAALRLARRASGLGDEGLLRELGADLGADVPAQVRPGRWLASGAGERLDAIPDPSPPLGLLLLPLAVELSTAAVYAEADRLGLARPPHALADRRLALHAALELGAPLPATGELLGNDLQAAAISLCPQIADALSQAREAGAERSLLSGSGPTVVGLFAPELALRQRRAGPAIAGLRLAQSAADALSHRTPAPICAVSVDAAFAEAAPVAWPA